MLLPVNTHTHHRIMVYGLFAAYILTSKDSCIACVKIIIFAAEHAAYSPATTGMIYCMNTYLLTFVVLRGNRGPTTFP